MKLDEFETQVKEALDVGLNQLQTVTLLVANLEQQLELMRRNIQELAQGIDSFITAEKQKREQEQN
jgi:hypothetical protein